MHTAHSNGRPRSVILTVNLRPLARTILCPGGQLPQTGSATVMRSHRVRPRAIYLLAHSPYPTVSGGARRAANIVTALEDSFDLTVLAASGGNAEVPGWSQASSRFNSRRRTRSSLILDLLEGIVRGQHVLLVRSVRAGLPAILESWLQDQRPELVVLGRPMLGPFMEVAHRAGAQVVIDADESLPRVAWSMARSPHASRRIRLRSAVEALTILGRMEGSSYPRADQLWVSSGQELAWLARIVDRRRICVVPNAVEVPPAAPNVAEVNAVSFLGWYGYPPNEAAALELMRSIMPAIRVAGGPRSLVLIGAQPTPSMARVAADTGEVSLTGQVADVVPALRAAGILVVPVRAGGGTRVKILEAMAAGVPVVSTRLGIEGLGLNPGEHVLVAESPAEFAAQVVALAADYEYRERLVRASYELVRNRYSIGSVRSSVEEALSGLRAGAGRAAASMSLQRP